MNLQLLQDKSVSCAKSQNKNGNLIFLRFKHVLNKSSVKYRELHYTQPMHHRHKLTMMPRGRNGNKATLSLRSKELLRNSDNILHINLYKSHLPLIFYFDQESLAQNLLKHRNTTDQRKAIQIILTH